MLWQQNETPVTSVYTKKRALSKTKTPVALTLTALQVVAELRYATFIGFYFTDTICEPEPNDNTS